MTRIFNTAPMKDRRRELRSNMTDAESMLWARIRRKQVDGFRFRRQYSIGHFVVDFYCPEIKLVIEVDGPTHDGHDAKEYDAEREEQIRSLEITVLRFKNEAVYNGIDGVVAKIRETAQGLNETLNSGMHAVEAEKS